MVEPWNKVNLPCPSAVSSCQITFNDTTASITECLVAHCEDALQLLCSDVLRTEIRVLYEIMYVVNNSLRKHKPFRAIKQVEQCINRLNEMKLQRALQDVEELCPNKTQRDEGVEFGHCSVPSQPVLEWFCLKLLGASSLVARTLDQCTIAFSLTRQHLYLAEFIVLNLVLTSMLSRLWVFFRGILRTLVPVYQRAIELRLEVAQCRPMAYLTDFPLPENLQAFLGPTRADLLQEGHRTEPSGLERRSKPSLLDKLFEAGERERPEEQGMSSVLASEGMESSTDLGRAVLRRGPHHSPLDIKLMLQRIHGGSKQHAAEVTVSPAQWGVSKSAVEKQKRTLLKRLKAASSFSDMAVLLEDVMGWCRRWKLHQERRHLAFVLLRCRRMKALECEGISVQKKLRRTWLSVRRVMLKGTSLPRSSPYFRWRTRGFLRTRFTIMARYQSVRNRFRVRTRSQIAKDLFGATDKSSQKYKMDSNISSFQTKFFKSGGSGREVVLIPKEKQKETEKASMVPNDEIDDIFSSLGF
ncbi:nucleolus and neural progenitor protein [Electrophorus electricus]|uniref:Nucleolus and neural progenitor protein-like N-terminal domain-containing protein n=1 Tax=Electrophorus electricus TaxID=8005 RepID=A0A4W4GKU3_ELEEL|nr:nucleolus and neural progenitor protein [Electrophorus electricus]